MRMGDSPYFSLKSSFTCSRRITFSPSLLASSSSAKQKKTGNKTPRFFLVPWKTHPTVTRHDRVSAPMPPAWRGDTSEAAALRLHLASPFRAVQSSYKMLPNLHLPRAATAESILHPLCGAVNDCKICKATETQALSATNAPTSDIKE